MPTARATTARAGNHHEVVATLGGFGFASGSISGSGGITLERDSYRIIYHPTGFTHNHIPPYRLHTQSYTTLQASHTIIYHPTGFTHNHIPPYRLHTQSYTTLQASHTPYRLHTQSFMQYE